MFRYKKHSKRNKRGGDLTKRSEYPFPPFFNKKYNSTVVAFDLDEVQKGLIISKLEQIIPDSCIEDSECGSCRKPSYLTIIRDLTSGDKIVTIYGGAVRDYIFSNLTDITSLNDIDINVRIEFPKIVDIFKKEPYNCYRQTIDEETKYILIGKKTSRENIEGYRIAEDYYFPITLEARSNSLSLAILPDKITLIDLFNGKGISDAQQRIYCAPFMDDELTNDSELLQWAASYQHTNFLWRMLKFLGRGFQIEFNTAKALYKYWWANIATDKTEWDAIWTTINKGDTKNIQSIFRKEGLLHNNLKRFKYVEGVPTYEQFMSVFIQKKLMADVDGIIIPINHPEYN